MQINKQGTEKNSQNYFCPKVARFSDMPVCLKSGITAKPLYVRIHYFGFRCVIVMCILCNFFAFLYFKITELWPFLCYFFYISLIFLCKFEERLYPVTLLLPALSRRAREATATLQTGAGLTRRGLRPGERRCLRNRLKCCTGLSWRQIKTCIKHR